MDLSNPQYKALIDAIAASGVEIVPHTIRPVTESRSVVDSGMSFLTQNYGTRDWIDHDAAAGDDNFECLASQGTIKGDPNYSLDLFAKHNYTYAWSYLDSTDQGTNLNLLFPQMNDRETPMFYYNSNVDDNPATTSGSISGPPSTRTMNPKFTTPTRTSTTLSPSAESTSVTNTWATRAMKIMPGGSIRRPMRQKSCRLSKTILPTSRACEMPDCSGPRPSPSSATT